MTFCKGPEQRRPLQPHPLGCRLAKSQNKRPHSWSMPMLEWNATLRVQTNAFRPVGSGTSVGAICLSSAGGPFRTARLEPTLLQIMQRAAGLVCRPATYLSPPLAETPIGQMASESLGKAGRSHARRSVVDSGWTQAPTKTAVKARGIMLLRSEINPPGLARAPSLYAHRHARPIIADSGAGTQPRSTTQRSRPGDIMPLVSEIYPQGAPMRRAWLRHRIWLFTEFYFAVVRLLGTKSVGYPP